ncbi:dihydrofolate reductase family protein [Actinomadura kijaniata]|uniref:Dihydrofolate reductase n=1 Tax=Actinomadura namibiensis TaxID=182080 RepID=A0A7W3QMU2_ACTNM|nr:dihydrofolate reductase family protein [Actinomadura namibiensis]MBA8952947.1 dihydrofolate reductase [Actinomadura namibiensis]
MTTHHDGRKVVGNIALSLDGRITGPGGAYDMGWIGPHAISDGARDHLARLTGAATTVLLGRKNYEGFGGYWPTVAQDPAADPRDRAFAQWLDATEKVVLSTTLTEPTWQNSRILATDPAAAVKDLRGMPGGDILVLASADVITALLRAGELDRLSVTQCPEIVGGGRRLFDDGLPASSWRPAGPPAVTDSGALCLLYDRVGG